jgi:hypothetical protein
MKTRSNDNTNSFGHCFISQFAASAALLCIVLALPKTVAAQFVLQVSITNPETFTPNQLAITQAAIVDAEERWEREITGYQPGITQTVLPITLTGTSTGFGDANGLGRYFAGGFWLYRSGAIRINRDLVEQFSDFGDNNVNVIDDLVAHEIGHVLGIGTLWDDNGLYSPQSGQYTGEFGLAAYQRYFDATATFVPVERAGNPGSVDAHWDQLLRSAGEAGMADDPFDLSPLTGIEDEQGRDLALELMTAALDPDFGDPFLSQFTIQSLRDLGFTVRAVPEPSAILLLTAASGIGVSRRSRQRRRSS